jgi:large subunit ribosomal protein L4e
MTTRQVVRVFSHENPQSIVGETALPDVFKAPIRTDIVLSVHNDLAKNKRQAHGVNKDAGMLYNAESWGTGRAVARIPRVGGSGTHRSGQGAFGNMCRGGRMFNPKMTWRRWHRKVNLTLKRHAVASAIAATAVPSLVLARGHRVNQVPELPLVVDKLNAGKTKDLLSILKRLGVVDDIEKVVNTRKIRPGQGKSRNRRYQSRKGPLIVYDNEAALIKQAASNLPGVEVCHIDRLNLLQLAPGGHVGRFVVWTKSAFERLTNIFGTIDQPSLLKKGYILERPTLTNANVSRIINSDEIQSIVRKKQSNTCLHERKKRNPLKNRGFMSRLNPFDRLRKAAETKKVEEAKKNKETRLKNKRVARKAHRKQGRSFITSYRKGLNAADEFTVNDYNDYISKTKIGVSTK